MARLKVDRRFVTEQAWTAIVKKRAKIAIREDMPEKFAAVKNAPAMSSEQREQLDKLSNAGTNGMRGGDEPELRKQDEQRERYGNLIKEGRNQMSCVARS